mgnify:CR=1 FL=1
MKKNKTSHLMPVYGDRKLEFIRGKGALLYSKDKKKYLDFGGGIAVNSLGHCHPKVVKALQKQSKKLWHTSNLYYSEKQEEYAALICKHSFAEKVFFTNSGTEAIECGIKVIRSFYNNSKRNNIITFDGAFHGRTLGALSAQKNSKYTKQFKPLLPGFKKALFNDFYSLKKMVDERTCAIMIEPIQGEGGVRPVSLSYLDKVKNLCVKNNILLFLDEVQSGFGRSGKLFAYQWSKIKPDIMAVAKGIGSGFPMGACLTTHEASKKMTFGKHGSTFGGNPLAIAVGKAVIEEITRENFLKKVDKISRYLWLKLIDLEKNFDEIIEIRGAGLLLGIKVKSNNIKISKVFSSNGLLSIPASDNVVRLAPPLIITFKDVDRAIEIIRKSLKDFCSEKFYVKS